MTDEQVVWLYADYLSQHSDPHLALCLTLARVIRKVRPDVPKRLTPPQVAKKLGVSPHTVRTWIRDGELKAIRVGRMGAKKCRLVVDPESLAEFEKRRQAPVREPRRQRRRKDREPIVKLF
jgi:excisionase family DNA binding protein